MPSTASRRLFPFERPLLPFVYEADDENRKEDHHRHEAEKADVGQHDGPREEEGDLEVAFLFPWAVSLGDIGMFGFCSMVVFLGVLTVGFVYEWNKGALEWE